LAAGTIDRVYLCLGEESWLARDAVEAIARCVLAEAGCDWGKEEFTASETAAASILRAATAAPLLGGRQLLVVRGVEKLKKADKDAFPASLAAIPDTTVLVLTARSLDGRTTFARELKQLATVVGCEPLAEERIPAWIAARLAIGGRECKAEAGVAERLLELVGTDLGTLDGELDKLVQYVGERRTITRDDVDRVAAGGVGASLAELVQAVGERRVPAALAAVGDLLEAGHSPIEVLAWLGYRFHDMWRAQDLGNQRGVWIRPEARQQARRYQPAELRRAAALILEADGRLKSSGGDPRLVLESLIRKVAGGE
jgi:DNA polymerase-3 subunit delta